MCGDNMKDLIGKVVRVKIIGKENSFFIGMEEEKKINEIITLTNEKKKQILKRRKNIQQFLFNEKDFERNFSLKLLILF